MKNIIKRIKEKQGVVGKVRATLRNIYTGEITHCTGWVDNIITDAGRAALARVWGKIGSVANEGSVTYGAVGDGSNTPAGGDTVMNNEIARNLLSTSVSTGAISVTKTFFNSATANQLITQFALFGEDASAAADSGTMMEYVAFDTPFTKTNIETLTVEISVTFS